MVLEEHHCLSLHLRLRWLLRGPVWSRRRHCQGSGFIEKILKAHFCHTPWVLCPAVQRHGIVHRVNGSNLQMVLLIITYAGQFTFRFNTVLLEQLRLSNA